MVTPDILFSSLIADLEASLGPDKNWRYSESLTKLFHIRNCVIELIGPYSESALWDIAISGNEFFNMASSLASPMQYLRVFKHPDASLTDKSLSAPLEYLMGLYTVKLGGLIGQRIVCRHLDSCLLRIGLKEI